MLPRALLLLYTKSKSGTCKADNTRNHLRLSLGGLKKKPSTYTGWGKNRFSCECTSQSILVLTIVLFSIQLPVNLLLPHHVHIFH